MTYNPVKFHDPQGDSVADLKRAIQVYDKLMRRKSKNIQDGYLKEVSFGNKVSYVLTTRAKLEFLIK